MRLTKPGEVVLEIQLCPVHPSIGPDTRSWNVHRGGPDVLLQWLETQLGLQFDPITHSHRVTEYAGALDKVRGAGFAGSLATDRWATADELLARRTELRLAGWGEKASEALPDLVKDLARVAGKTDIALPDEAQRLTRVLSALDAGQQLPAHVCRLHDPPERWPEKWRQVLERLRTQRADPGSPAGKNGTALQQVQTQVRSGNSEAITADRSLRWISSTSVFTACETVAATLARDPAELAETVVCCEEDAIALCLDGGLARLGLPTMGASIRSLSHPVYQVLPLVLDLCWEPVNPARLLDFLSLPVSPIPRRAASRLAEALREQPGLGSTAWEEALEELCGADSDPERELKERLTEWLGLALTHVRRGEAVPADLVAERCSLVCQWTAGYASHLTMEGENEELAAALRAASIQATSLAELAQGQGPSLTEPQLLRLRDAALQHGRAVRPHLEAAGGPRLIASLAEIAAPCSRLVWLGLGAAATPISRWTAAEREALSHAGIELDDGSRRVAALRDAELRGFCRVSQSLLAVALPDDEQKQPHPLWMRVEGALRREEERPLLVDDLLARGKGTALQPWVFETATTRHQRPESPSAIWKIPPSLLSDRATSSATELEDRLACPLKWTLRYLARLQPSPIAALPGSFLLKGNFCHGVLEAVFGAGRELATVEEAVKEVTAVFDERLPLDAAPLAQADSLTESERLRAQLSQASRTLVRALRAGKYTVSGMEVPVTGQIQGRELTGRIDCLAVRKDGSEAIIDFKYAGRNKYRDLIQEGRATQLATYAYSRCKGTGKRRSFPVVGYLILADGLFYAPSASAPQGLPQAAIIEAPGIGDVWAAFSDALEQAEGWLADGNVPVRPLQHSENWPEGAEIVLSPADEEGVMPDSQSTCEYCDFKALCGLTELW